MVKNKNYNRYIVGAYATSPNLFTWDESLELKYFNGLKKLSSIRGLELPFWGEGLHPFDTKWLLSNLDTGWENVLTCIPGTMKELNSDPYFGLASKNEKSRKNAIDFYYRAFEEVAKLKIKLGSKALKALFISSAPYFVKNKTYANKKCFILSLIELASWDWGDTNIFIEHCDAYNTNNPKPKKGFLPIKDEIDAIHQTNKKLGKNIKIVINWGRSVIEYRDINGPIKHIKKAIKNNLLGGLMFSGTTASKNNHYGAWSDLHMPPAKIANFKYFEPDSLMTYKNIKNILKISKPWSLDYLGIKLLAMPKNSSINKRISINKDTMVLLDKALNEINKI